jgi:putative transposase
VVTVTGGHNSRVSLAALIAVKAGQRPRLVYRVHRARRGDKRKGFAEADYIRLLDAAHQQLGGPLVLVWDNLNTHASRAMPNLVKRSLSELTALVKTRLRRMQYRPGLLNSFLARTRLNFTSLCNPRN